MTDAPKYDLRDKPKRDRLTEPEARQARLHIDRHAHRSSFWLSELLWITEDLVDELR